MINPKLTTLKEQADDACEGLFDELSIFSRDTSKSITEVVYVKYDVKTKTVSILVSFDTDYTGGWVPYEAISEVASFFEWVKMELEILTGSFSKFLEIKAYDAEPK